VREAAPSDILAEPPSVPTPEQTESASSSAEHQLCGTKDEEKLPIEDDPKKAHWPSMVDLNTRLRRVITSYQRNFKKEEMRLAQKAKVWLVLNIYFSVHALLTFLQNNFCISLKLLSVILKLLKTNVCLYVCLFVCWNLIKNIYAFLHCAFFLKSRFKYTLALLDGINRYHWFPNCVILKTPWIRKESHLTV